MSKTKAILKIGKIEIENALILAPMEGATDLPFRIICKRMGADLVFSEFVASEALIRDSEKSYKKIRIEEEERPVAVQIFGANPRSMAEAAKIVENSGADIIDLNFGCPAKKVVKNNAGAALLKDLDLMGEIVGEVVAAVELPVTAKTRLGWDADSIVAVEAAKTIEKAGASALTMHCRTRAMGFGGEADWSWINKIKEAVDIPVILNGDVKSPRDAKRAFDETKCDGVMIGRAAIGNPFIFKRAKRYLRDGVDIEITPAERISACLEHLKLSAKYKREKNGLRGIYEFRKYYSGYLKGLYNSAKLRSELVLMENLDEIERTLLEYLEFLEKRERSDKNE